MNVAATISERHRRMVVPHSDGLANLSHQSVKMSWKGIPHLAMPHDNEHVRLARNFGITAPAPINTYYDFPGGTPFEAQRHTVELLTTELRAYVLNGMGTGKTRTVLWAYDYLRQMGEVDKMLVVAPLSTLNTVWWREAFIVNPDLKVVVLYGSRAVRLKLLAQDADIYVINHDAVDIVVNEVIQRTDIDVVCLDELAAYRNSGSHRFKTMRKLLSHKARAWGLTGSPTPNAPTDAWAQCKLITPWTVPTGFGSFRDQVMLKVTQFKWVPKASATQTVQQIMQPAVRFSLDDVAELPDLIIRTVMVDQGPKQIKVYETLERHLHAMFEQGEITVLNSGILMSKLLQVSMGWVYTKERNTIPLDNVNRLEALVDAIHGTERKVIVFVPFIHALEGVSSYLDKAGINHETVSGDTSKAVRDKVFANFQNDSHTRVIVAHPACMSHGLTLTAASTIVWFGPYASLDTFDQANARITRVGQKHKQQVLLLCGTKAEERLYRRLQEKQGVQQALLDLFRSDTATRVAA